jgi:hypothetical protein
VEYLVRAARVTDIDRLVALADDGLRSGTDSPLAAADLMRQLVYLPQASIVVAETHRSVVGGAVLALRPSVRSGGYVGTIDLLVLDPDHDADGITEDGLRGRRTAPPTTRDRGRSCRASRLMIAAAVQRARAG